MNSIGKILPNDGIIVKSGKLFASTMLGAIVLFISNIILSKQFGPEAFGNYKTVIGLFLFLPYIADLGINYTLTKYIAEYKERKDDGKLKSLIVKSLSLKLLVMIAIAAAAFAFQTQIAEIFLQNGKLSPLVAVGALTFAMAFADTFKYIAMGLQDFSIVNKSQLMLQGSIGILTVALGVWYGVQAAIFAWGIGYLLSTIFIAKKMFEIYSNPKQEQVSLKNIFSKYSLKIFVSNFPSTLNLALIPAMSLLFSQEKIGYLSLAYTFYTGVYLLSTAIMQVLMPKISQLNARNSLKEIQEKEALALKAYAIVCAIGIAGTLLLSDWFISLLSPAYLKGIIVFKTLVIFGFILGFGTIKSAKFAALGQSRKLMTLSIGQNAILYIASFIALSMI